jgi:hypothetical protein
MTSATVADPVTISVPRAVLDELANLSADFVERMHELLERNTDGQLNASEKLELERLVRIAEFGQIISTALRHQGQP